ncbi:hypothetical protein [Oscillibacter sp.]|uniref:hypothetical protein n=1 Tax=Oscillibacter sp. TaxID=1945593 RepID=UPI0028980D45|nr:hypothetical protein [Oscillibacter sp.]
MTYVKKTGKRAAVLGLALWVLLLCGCGETVTVRADLSDYGESPITIRGLKDEDFTVTPNELAELDCVKRTATGATAKQRPLRILIPEAESSYWAYAVTAIEFVK